MPVGFDIAEEYEKLLKKRKAFYEDFMKSVDSFTHNFTSFIGQEAVNFYFSDIPDQESFLSNANNVNTKFVFNIMTKNMWEHIEKVPVILAFDASRVLTFRDAAGVEIGKFEHVNPHGCDYKGIFDRTYAEKVK